MRQALDEAGIAFEQRTEKEGGKNQFEMHEFYVSRQLWEKASSTADEAVNLFVKRGEWRQATGTIWKAGELYVTVWDPRVQVAPQEFVAWKLTVPL